MTGMQDQAAAMIELKTRFDLFMTAYEKDRADDRAALAALSDQLAELGRKEQQAIGAMRMAKFGYAVIGTLAMAVYAIGLPRVGAWLMNMGK